MKQTKALIIALIALVVLISTLAMAVQLSRQNQDTRSRASEPSPTPVGIADTSQCTYDNQGNIVCPYWDPAPGFCADGTIVYSGTNVCGCQNPPSCLQHKCWNRVISCPNQTDGSNCWPTSCGASEPDPTGVTCQDATPTPLTDDEVWQYNLWLSQGSPVYPGCGLTGQDDLFFELRNLFFTINNNPATSNICGLTTNQQYTLDIQWGVQNLNKTIDPESKQIIAQLKINDTNKGTVSIPYNMIIDHQDGASYPFTDISFTPRNGENTIEITIDTSNAVTEINEQNNTHTKTFTVDNSSCNTPSFDYNQDGSINLLDYNLFLNAWLQTLGQ